ncbi:MAG TPA: TonB-dependent receptor [Terracidiphilus sp.]|nr:TonB-dependent receptor [Terracidiphilus sp.]
MISSSRMLSCVRILSTIFSLMLFAILSHAQSDKGAVAVSVVDSSGAALKGAQLKLLPLGLSAATDDHGMYTFQSVAPGSYTISASFVGLKDANTPVEITAGQTQNVEVQLGVSAVSDEILVVAARPHGEAEAINETRTADNILQVLPAQVITSLPNANVADAIGRLPSVTLYRIEGEGVYVQVRGTEPRLTNVTVDGITLPAPEPTVREVRLDVIPSELVESVEINKTLSANQDADGIGGSVNLITKSAQEKPTYDLFVKGGYTPILDGRAASETGGTYGKRFGAAKKFGVLFNASYDYNGRGIDNIQPALDPLSTFNQPFYDNDTIREYRYYRYRYGFAGSADYKLNDATSFYAHGLYTDLKDWGDKWYYSPVSKPLTMSNGVITAPNPAATSSAPKFYTSSKRPNASVGSLILGGRQMNQNSWFTWETSASRSYEVDSAGNPKADFSWIGPSVYCNYDPSAQTAKYRPRFGDCDGPNSILQNADDWAYKDITISTGLTAELDLTAAASYAHNYTVHGHFGTLEAGFKFTNAHKSQNSTESVYDGWSTKAASPQATMAQLQSGFENTDFYNGSYFGGRFGPVSDFYKVQSYTLSTLAGYLDPYKTAQDTYPNLFHYVEQIPAWYIMNTVDLGKLHLQTGLRFEDTLMNTFGYNLTFYGPDTPTQLCGATLTDCWTVDGIKNNPSYLDVLPSVQIRYGLTPNSNLRAVYARGVARPDPYQLVPYVTEDDSSNPASVTVGNPSLRPEHANNYDLLYEDYLHPLGMIQAGIFFKQLTAPQLEFQIPAGVDVSALPPGTLSPSLLSTVEQYQNSQLGLSSVTQYINGENAYLYGFEISFQQHLSYLPGVMGGFGIAANYSFTGSREKGVPLRTDHPRLIDQAANTWNISPTYDTKRFSMRLGMTYNGKSPFEYDWISPAIATGAGADPSGLGPTGPSGDVWTLAHMQVDAQATYRFWRGMSFLVSGLNLNNEVFGYYTGSDQFVNQREYYKPTYTGGLRYDFGRER